MCVKINCTLYIVQRTMYNIAYICVLRNLYLPLNCVFTLAGPTHFARISKIMTRQIRNFNVCKCCE